MTSREGTCSLGVPSKFLEAVVWLQPRSRRGPFPLNWYCCTQLCTGAFRGCRRSRTASVHGGETPLCPTALLKPVGSRCSIQHAKAY